MKWTANIHLKIDKFYYIYYTNSRSFVLLKYTHNNNTMRTAFPSRCVIYKSTQPAHRGYIQAQTEVGFCIRSDAHMYELTDDEVLMIVVTEAL